MCGIGGLVVAPPRRLNGAITALPKMSTILRHRGPDDEGFALLSSNERKGIALAGPETVAGLGLERLRTELSEQQAFNIALVHRRLSIQDLSSAGHQPLCDDSGQIWITYNGEVFNFQEIRAELQSLGHHFVSRSDSEVVLKAYKQWGQDCLHRFNGMWAFVIVDLQHQQIFASRDRFGIKPLYYVLKPNYFAFASEIKVFTEAGLIPAEINPNAAMDFLVRARQDEGAETFLKDVRQLRGGESLSFSLNEEFQPKVRTYWTIEPAKTMPSLSIQERTERFFDLFKSSVELRLISDVPAGVLVSGGLDSSSIVCVADKVLGHEGLRSFSARYKDSRHDESYFIDAVLRETRTAPIPVHPNEKSLIGDLQNLVYSQDEPFGSLSIFAQWNVFKAIGESGLKVVLDGQGADEQLAGYHAAFPVILRGLLEQGQLLRFARELKALKHNHAISALQLSAQAAKGWAATLWRGRPARFRNDSFEDYLFKSTIRPGLHALLHFEDRNSMAFSVESRLPFLDHRLVEFIFSCPVEDKFAQGTTKAILRRSMTGILPEEVRLRQDKIGFSVPQDSWFRGEMKGLIQDLVASGNSNYRSYLDPKQAVARLEAHISGREDQSSFLWRTASFELWCQRFLKNRPRLMIEQ